MVDFKNAINLVPTPWVYAHKDNQNEAFEDSWFTHKLPKSLGEHANHVIIVAKGPRYKGYKLACIEYVMENLD